MARMTGAQAIAASFLAENVEYLFGIPGWDVLDILDAVRGHPQFRFILTRHEQGASYMAYGCSRGSRKPTVCLATCGPGATNLVSGIAAAHKASIPMIAITGKQERRLLEIGGLQELDQVALYAPITKWSHLVSNAEKIPQIMRKAFQVALSWPQGPVHLNFPSDILAQEIEFEPEAPAARRAASFPSWNGELIATIAADLLAARAPVVIAGRELLWDDSVQKVVELAELLGIPAVTTMDQMDTFPNTHSLGLGPMGAMGGWSLANRAVSNADLILALGVRFDYDLTSTRTPHHVVPRDARIIQINRGLESIGVVYPVHIGAAGQLGSFVDALINELKGGPGRPPTIGLEVEKRRWYSERAAAADGTATPIKAAYAAHVLREILPKDGAIVVDVGNFTRFVRPYLDTFQPGTFYYTENFVAVGSALPMSIGLKLAKPSQQVVCLCGDGGMGMNLSEIETAVREKVKVTAVVLNDFGFGNIRSRQRDVYESRFIGTDFSYQDFARLAEGYGALGLRVDRSEELPRALETALASDLPAVVDIHVDRRDFGAS